MRGGGAASLIIACIIASGAHAQTVTYLYDAKGQLVSATTAGGATVAYTYDANGNRTQKAVTGGTGGGGGNTAPVAVDDADYIDGIPPGTSQGGGPQSRLYYVLANDTDADSHTLTITSVTKISGATSSAATVAGGGTHLSVTGITIGTHVFDYVISDGNGGTDTGRMTVYRTWEP